MVINKDLPQELVDPFLEQVSSAVYENESPINALIDAINHKIYERYMPINSPLMFLKELRKEQSIANIATALKCKEEAFRHTSFIAE